MKKAALALLLVLTGAPVVAQNETASAFQAGDFAGAARLARETLAESPEDPTARFLLGASLVQLGDAEEALSHLRLAQEHGYQPANAVRVNIARALVADEQPEAALAELKALADAGFRAVSVLQGPSFAALEGNAEFASIRQQVQKNATP